MQYRVKSGLMMVALAGAALLHSAATLAQSYPTRPVRIIVPVAAGGGSDILARIIGEKLSKMWGQNVVIDNKPGAAHILGTAITASAPPDGYTLSIIGLPHAVNPSIYSNLPYSEGDFAPIIMMAQVPIVLAVNAEAPYKTVADLVAAAKANPGKINFASTSTNGSGHLAGELMKLSAGIDMVHVPYRGSSAALVDVLGGRVPVMFDALVTADPQLKAKKLRGLAITTAQRSPEFPDIPTMSEAGFPNISVSGWLGLVAPRKTPDNVLAAINSAIVRVLADKDVIDTLQKQGWQILPIGSTRENFASFLTSEGDKWHTVAKSAGLKAE